MKLRIQENSLRLRLQRSEVKQLASGRPVEASAHFGDDQILRYRIEPGMGALRASFDSGIVRVAVSRDRIRQWTDSDDVGIYANSGPLQVVIEKDFQCLTRPEEEFNTEFYAHPERGLRAGHSQHSHSKQ